MRKKKETLRPILLLLPAPFSGMQHSFRYIKNLTC
jgi:hypothetical protein